MRFFCTYFDSNYFLRGMALYESLKNYCPSFTLWVLCLDEDTYAKLLEAGIPEIRLIILNELEEGIDGLAKARSNRSQVEYYFTCSPAMPLYILNSNPEIDLITYLDSDLYFYSDPEVIFNEMGGASVGIIRHRVSSELAIVEEHGIYNVGWVSFRRDESGLACLQWWCDRCIEWCYTIIEEDRYADQKYLNYFPLKFENVVVIENKGANLAPWNIANYHITVDDGVIKIDQQPLVFFHFNGFKQLSSMVYATGLNIYNVSVSRSVIRNIFKPYIDVLRKLGQNQLVPQGLLYGRTNSAPLWKQVLRLIRDYPRSLVELWTGHRVLFILGRVI